MSHVILLKIIIARFNLLLTGVDHYLYLCSGDMTAETHHLSSAEDCEKTNIGRRKLLQGVVMSRVSLGAYMFNIYVRVYQDGCWYPNNVF